jgi:hypothetical protein
MWLSLGISAISNSVWQLERPQPSSNRRCCARNDGLCMKKTENAAMPISAMA